MANDLFNVLGGSNAANDGGFGAMMAQFKQFQNNFKGNPQAEVQRLIQSGQMSQEQYNQLGQIARQILNMR